MPVREADTGHRRENVTSIWERLDREESVLPSYTLFITFMPHSHKGLLWVCLPVSVLTYTVCKDVCQYRCRLAHCLNVFVCALVHRDCPPHENISHSLCMILQSRVVQPWLMVWCTKCLTFSGLLFNHDHSLTWTKQPSSNRSQWTLRERWTPPMWGAQDRVPTPS